MRNEQLKALVDVKKKEYGFVVKLVMNIQT